jgi:hypothetical protein
MNKLETQSYETQAALWPSQGKHILAHHDQESVIVYQAYRESIGRYAAEHGHFGGPDFSFNQMSWIKPNFLWMMYRSGWGTKPGQEVVLALRLSRSFFESLLEQAVPSTFVPSMYLTMEAWQADVAVSDVRMQWDPDHAPDGSKLERRAIQLGLRGAALKAMAGDELLEVIDVSQFVAVQRQFIHAAAHHADLQTPVETVFEPQSVLARRCALI